MELQYGLGRMLENVPHRRVRCFSFYKSRHLVLTVEDRPGRLQSTAMAPPGGAPPHPFLDARAYDPFSEGELGELLRQATSFDHYLHLLIEAGYDAVSTNGSPPMERGRAFRLEDGQGRVGALWEGGGQFTCLAWQPVENELVFDHATLTVYRTDQAERLFQPLQASQTFEELRRRLETLGFRLIRLPEYTV